MEKREIGGWFDILGNTTMFANGFVAWRCADTVQRKRAGMWRMATGALWNIPNFIVARYGGQPVGDQFDRLQHKLAAHLEKEGVPLDVKMLKMAGEEKRRSYFHKVEDFLYNYPMECNSACLGLFSLGMMGSGFLRMRSGEKEAGIGNIAVSALTVAAALTGILVPEKTDEQLEKQGQKGTFWGLVQKYPLYFANIGILAADATEGLNSYGEFKTAHALTKNHPFRKPGFAISALSAATLVSYLIGDSLMGFGSKKAPGKVEDRGTAQKEIVREAARILAAQPLKAREALVKDVVQYMVSQRELRMTDYDPARLQQEILAAIQEHAGQGNEIKTTGQTQAKAVAGHAESPHKTEVAVKRVTADNHDKLPDSYVPPGAKTVKDATPQHVVQHDRLRDAQP